jgi:hypothetical protein
MPNESNEDLPEFAAIDDDRRSKPCDHCHSIFVPKRKDQRFCCTLCRVHQWQKLQRNTIYLRLIEMKKMEMKNKETRST